VRMGMIKMKSDRRKGGEAGKKDNISRSSSLNTDVVFGWVTGFTVHFQLLNTIHRVSIANSNIIQFILIRTESSRSALSSPILW
jgi:hypothetical protein